jgi:exosortase B
MNTMQMVRTAGGEVDTPGIATMWPTALGLLVLYVPTLDTMIRRLWLQDEYTHGPLIVAVCAFLLWRSRDALVASAGRGTTYGIPVFAVGLLLYVLGRSQEILMLEVGSAPWVIAGLVLMLHGAAALRKIWFPVFFMLFMIPLPGMVVETLTMPMKMSVSYVAESVLYSLGYPVARSGVILQIGQYKMFVADACAGLHTLLTLEAMGLFYLAVIRHASLGRNAILACLIVPISFTANLIRVITLALITFYLGDAAGQGFLHSFAGVLLFVSALALIAGVDTILRLRFPLS